MVHTLISSFWSNWSVIALRFPSLSSISPTMVLLALYEQAVEMSTWVLLHQTWTLDSNARSYALRLQKGSYKLLQIMFREKFSHCPEVQPELNFMDILSDLIYI